MSELSLPPPIGYFNLFEFQTYLKTADPPPSPLGSISDIFEFENILLMAEDPQTNILKGLFRHIYIKEGQIKCFILSFLGWGLKVTYNSDIFEKLRPPHMFSNVRI